MHTAPIPPISSGPSPGPPGGRAWTPPWMASLGLHVLLLAALALLIGGGELRESPADLRAVEIVLLPAAETGGRLLAETPAAAASGAAGREQPAAIQSLRTVPDVDLPSALPGQKNPPQGLPLGDGLLVGAGALTAGAARAALPGEPLAVPDESGLLAGRQPEPVGEPAELELFGVRGQGHRFVFVVDRSRSMGRGMNYVLEAAKAQLLACLGRLSENHQFQIVFYNDRPSQFAAGELPAATDVNKQRARQFIQSMTPSGQTQHDLAMLAALRLRPDVIYLLTDAHPPGLTRLDLDLIRKGSAGRITIHTIEFGYGKPLEPENFLTVLARENNGSYRYLDVAGPLEK